MILHSLWEWYYIHIHEIHVLLIFYSLWGLMGPDAAKLGICLTEFHARIPNFVMISVLGLWRPVPALSRSKDLQDRSPHGYLQGLHAPRAPAGRRQDRTYFQMYFHAIQRSNPLWFGHWLRQILFFKSSNNTSFPQQPICSSCTACAPNILCVCPLCTSALWSDSGYIWHCQVSGCIWLSSASCIHGMTIWFTSKTQSSLFAVLFQSSSDIWIKNAEKIVKERVPTTVQGQRSSRCSLKSHINHRT